MKTDERRMLMMGKTKKVDQHNIQDIISLTPMQEGMLFHYLSNHAGCQYFEQLTLKLSGQIEPSIIEKAWEHIIQANEMLRTIFLWERLEKPIQVVLKTTEVPLRVINLMSSNSWEQELKISELKENDYTEGIDISVEPYRLTLILLTPKEAVLILSNHHILLDGWSTGIILKEFLQAYNSMIADRDLKKIEKNRFKRYVKWLQARDSQSEIRYWSKYLADYSKQSSLPGEYIEEYSMVQVNHYYYKLSKDITRMINHFTKKNQITSATLFYGVWGLLLSRYMNTSDLLFGTTVSGRNADVLGIEEMVGLFINTIPLRVQVNSGQSILHYLLELDQNLRGRSEFEHTPLPDILAYSTSSSRGTLFETILILENYPLDKELNLTDSFLHVDSYSMAESTNYDLTLAIELNDSIVLQYAYNSNRFTAEFIQSLAGHLCNLLSNVLQSPLSPIKSLEMLSSTEKDKLLFEFNATFFETTESHARIVATLPELFEAQVDRTPNQLALIYEDEELTYLELNSKANQFARYLLQLGVQADQIIGIMVERSPEMIIGIIGILKAGGAYLPIDPANPVDRIQFILNDSETELLVTRQNLLEQISFEGQVVDLGDPGAYADNPANLKKTTTPENLAYIIYTSGSTGQPKGVLIEHQSIVQTICWRKSIYQMGIGQRILQIISFGFDGFVTTLFTPLVSGATAVLLNDTEMRDPICIKNCLTKCQITHLVSVPSLYNVLLGVLEPLKPTSLQVVTLAGEKLPLNLVQRSKSYYPDVELVNEYGPTENSVITTLCKDVAPTRTVSIGRPKDSSKVYILSLEDQLQPVGITGELCIAGTGLARGYLHRPELTEAKFVSDLFNPGGRMYRTGDLAKWNVDGTLEYVGRRDNQIKIRGFRVELEEIEAQLSKYAGIQEAVVVAHSDFASDVYLAAYIASDETISIPNLREFLHSSLPEYMIPSFIIQLERLPLTANGKIDRQALQLPENAVLSGVEYVAPGNQTEEQLVIIWQEILGLTQVGIYDNFFELGGHSLKATQLVGKIHKVFNVAVPLNQIFKTPTVKGISEYIFKASSAIYEKIEQVEQKEVYSVSSAQKRMYLLQQFDLKSTAYNISGALKVEGQLNHSRVEQIVQRLIHRHETLRTSFAVHESGIAQRVHDQIEFTVKWIEGKNLMNEDQESIVNALLREFVRPFDLQKTPLFRVGVLCIAEDEHILLFDMHHIISDGISINILIREFVQLYEGRELDDLPIQYKDYAEWQQTQVASGVWAEQKAYWLNRFQGDLPVLDLQTDFPRPKVNSFTGNQLNFTLDQQLTHGIKQLSHATGSTIYMILLSVINILLAKYSGQEDVIVGTPVAGRRHVDLDRIIGMFVNTLAMRNYPTGDKTYREFLQEVKTNVLQDFDNQDFQFEDLVDSLHIDRDISRNPLFDVLLAVQNMEHTTFDIEDLSIVPYELIDSTAKFDLAISVSEVNTEFLFQIRYRRDLFKQKTIARMGVHFTNILSEVLVNGALPLHEIKMLSEQERLQILNELSYSEFASLAERTILQIFEEQVAKNPSRIAVAENGGMLTYHELNQRVNQLASSLRGKGVSAECVVGILIDRSLDMMIGILGIMKAGGAYLPIGPDYPIDRVEYILKDSGTQILVTQQKYQVKYSFPIEVVNLEAEVSATKDSENLNNLPTPGNLAYIIYTSGTTGRPKGVGIEHHSLLNTLTHLQKNYPLHEDDVILQSTVYTFDASVREIFWWIMNGSKCYLLAPDGEKDPYEIVETIRREMVTVAKFVPILVKEIFRVLEEIGIENVSTLRYLLVGGEALDRQVVDTYFQLFDEKTDSNHLRPKFINVYGPSETTIHCTEYVIDEPIPYALVPIGKPIINNRVYILDLNLKPVPIGVPGELYVSGVGVGREYIHNPILTLERFISDPFSSGDRMYRTGDRVKWLSDGNIQFLNRFDHQLKIRGHRIESGEIENILLSHPKVLQTVVTDFKSPSEDVYLIAYYVVKVEIRAEELRIYLQGKLPEYMIPAYFVQLTAMPVNANGKINRHELPLPDIQKQHRECIAPQNAVEEKLLEIWQQVLGVDKISTIDNFFELGGHSLKATILAAKIQQNLQVKIPLVQIFSQPTIQGLAAYIYQGEQVGYSPIEHLAEQEYYETSSAQKRIYLLQQMEPASVSYNMPAGFKITGELDFTKLNQVFYNLIQRHQAFRTCFAIVDQQISQKVERQIMFQIPYLNMVDCPLDITKIIQDFVRPFDLSHAPLLRLSVIKFSDTEHLMLIDMHHIISDGLSMDILIEEFCTLYQGHELPELMIQYTDFAHWQNHQLASQEMLNAEAYWLECFQDEIQPLTLPTDYPRPPVMSHVGERVRFTVHGDLVAKLREIGSRQGATLFMTLLAMYNILLSRYSGQEEIIVGTPVAGRDHPDLQNIIGMFVNTLVLKNTLSMEMTFIEFLEEVKSRALSGFEHQNYQFEMLVEKLNLKRTLGSNPLLDVMFAFQSKDESIQSSIDQLKIEPWVIEHNIAKFDLTLNIEEIGDQLHCQMEYKTSLFCRETIKRMVGHLLQIMEEVAECSEIHLSAIKMITPIEREMFLSEFCGTEVKFSGNQTIQQVFEEQVNHDPNHVALIFADQQITYGELNVKANQLARKLRNLGVQRDTIVGLLVERSFEMLVGIMGVLKSGGAYLPIDPDYPKERIRYILEDSQTQILLTQDFLIEEVDFAGDLINLKDERVFTGIETNLDNLNALTDLTYVMYTSGTTGKPKGNLTCHKNILRVVKETDYITIYPEDRVLQLSTYAFDGSTFDIFGGLLNGATLVLMSKDMLLDIHKLTRLIKSEKITVFFITTALFNMIMDTEPDAIRGVRKILVGGEKLSIPHMIKGLEHSGPGRLSNAYGPTECTVFTTAYTIKEIEEDWSSIPIGRPIAYTGVYVLNEWDQLQPIGVVGELCVIGDGLARGYLHQPELTAQKFVNDPYCPDNVMYRTGDLVCWKADGNLEFIGRKDNQVKLRGFRIELSEIEARLMNHPAVRKAVVLDKLDHSRSMYLCGYLEIKSDWLESPVATDNELERTGQSGELPHDQNMIEKELITSLKEYLAKELPEYMIPSHFMILDKFPVNSSGKLNRQAFPEPVLNLATGKGYVPPGSELEVKLGAIWSEILDFQPIGIHDNFFELGGQSLKAMLMISMILQELHIELPLRVIFERQTIQDLAEYIQMMKPIHYREIQQVQQIPGCPAGTYPVSSAQKRLYIQSQLEGIGISYNMPGAVKIAGKLDQERFKQVFEIIISRHETLRTSFISLEGEILQKISPNVELPLCIREASETDVPALFHEFLRPFVLKSAPLIRLELINLTEGDYLMFFDMHHIISDGLSIENLIKEFAALYQGEELPALRIQYKDYAIWQNQLFQIGEIESQKQYWFKVFQNEIPVLNMPTDFPRPAFQSFRGERYEVLVPEELVVSLRQLAVYRSSTLYMVLLAVYNILLAKYTGQDDLIIGTPVAGRRHPDVEKLLGMFVNMLALRNQPVSGLTFSEFLGQVREKTIQAFDNQDYQFEELVEELDLTRDMSRNALFDVVFALQEAFSDGVIETEDLRFTPYDLEGKVSKFDLTLEVRNDSDKMCFCIEYCVDLFTQRRIERLATHYIQIIQQVVKNPEITLRELDILTVAERRQILDDFNHTQMEFAETKTLHELFSEQVQKTPDNVALVDGTQSWTYLELDVQTYQLARRLRDFGIRPDEGIAILAERSGEMIIAILASLKAGGAYLPIDPDYPEARIQYMLEDSEVRVLLTHKGYARCLSFFKGQVLDISEESLDTVKGVVLENINRSTDLAYIMYTSGSTGTPKGVMIEHRGVVSLAEYYNHLFNLDQGKNVLHMSNVAFDTSVVEIFPPLLYGSTVYVIDKELALNRPRFREYVVEKEINFVQFVPMMLHEILANSKKLTPVETVIVGGDQLDDSLKDQILAQGYRLTNHYGPTEGTVDATIARCTIGVSTIGKPIANTHVYIVDKDGHLTPIGVPGEICIAGVGLARGYLNQPELTAERFVVNPEVSSERLYRTGDLGRWMEDGNIQFAGRLDYQVKIRGYRIELGEIEKEILRNEKIEQAVVVDLLDTDDQKYLCGYLVVERLKTEVRASDAEVNSQRSEVAVQQAEISVSLADDLEQKAGELKIQHDQMDIDKAGIEEVIARQITSEEQAVVAELRDELRQRLPEYMVPSHFMILDEIPLTTNGKVDRKALPMPELNDVVRREYLPPANETEEKLVGIWSQVLNRERIGVLDSFFELGGHSLKMMTMTSKIFKEFQVDMPLGVVFKQPTIRELAQYIINAERTHYSEIRPIQGVAGYPLGTYPASSAQKRLFIQNQFAGIGSTYNMPGALLITGQLDIRRLETAFQRLVARHDTLRTSFDLMSSEVVQKIAPEVHLAIPIREVTEQGVEEAFREFVRPFDLSIVPLLRIELGRVNEAKQIMFFDMHHIISDGISIENMIREFISLYQNDVQSQLPPLKIQYKDFAIWQNNLFQTGVMDAQKQYWLEVFAEEIPVLNLPTDYPRPMVQSFKGGRYEFDISEELTQRLHELMTQTETTLYMVLLTAFNLLLAKYTGQEDIIVGTPIAGRNHADLSDLIGMFVNMLALRNRPLRSLTYREFLLQVQESTLSALENQDYPFEELVEELQLVRDLSHNVLFDVVFSFQSSNSDGIVELDGVRFAPYNIEGNIAKFDLTLEVMQETDRICFGISYCSDLFSKESIAKLADHYQQILTQTTTNPAISLKTVDILTAAERSQILEEFNNTQVDFPIDKTLHQLFEEQVLRTPNRIAIVDGERCWTYQELDIRTNQLARHLREAGVRPDHLVALLTQRSAEMLTGILAILKAGGAYLPIDPDYPDERIQYMLEDSQTKILLTHREYARRFSPDIPLDFAYTGDEPRQTKSSLTQCRMDSNAEFGSRYSFTGHIMALDSGDLFTGDGSRLQSVNEPTDLAYVMYTSGSTGKPKGVMIEHRGVVNLAQFQNHLFGLEQGKRIFHMANVCFDTSVIEIFPPLIYGSSVYVIDKELALDRERFIQYAQKSEIQIAQFVPVTLQEILAKSAKPESLELIVVGGDKLDDSLKDQVLALGYRLTNHYGPTEITVYAIVALCEPGVTTIGKPIINTRAYVVDRDGQLAPVGVVGELCIAGIGLARGYLNKPELTAEKFITNLPFTAERVYRTGDLASWKPDGTITFHGRIDNQVKIRGYRIEPGEIENILLKHEAINSGVVIPRTDQNGEKYLCAYFVSEQKISIDELRALMAKDLPEYMIPAYFMQMDTLPLTRSGKVDRKALPEPELVLHDAEYQPPTSEVEARLVVIWEQVLGIEGIGITHNFFIIGGQSLKAVQIIHQIQKEFKIQISLSDIFKYPTIRELSSLIQSIEPTGYSEIEKLPEQEYYELSYNQKRLWIMHQLDPRSIAYNLSGSFSIDHPADVELINNILTQLMNRHESLRTHFKVVGAKGVQVIDPVGCCQLQVYDLIDKTRDDQQVRCKEIIKMMANTTFDLQRDPLLQVALIIFNKHEFEIVFCMHHIISDGWSMEILKREFYQLYAMYTDGIDWKPAPLEVQYKDFAAWQNRLIADDQGLNQVKDFWKNQLSRGVSTLNLPIDYPKGRSENGESAAYRLVISANRLHDLQDLATDHQTSLFVVMLTILNMLLKDLTGQDMITIGVPGSGRPHQSLKNVIGFFINTLVLVNQIKDDIAFDELLQQVNEDTLLALDYQNYPLELIIDELQIPYPDVQVFFNMLNMGESHLQKLENLDSYHIAKTQDSKFDLSFYLSEYANGLEISCVYLTDLYKPATVEFIMGEYLGMVDKVLGYGDEEDDLDDFILLK